MEGYWAGSGKVLRISIAADDPQALDFSQLTANGWAPTTSGMRLRTDGRFHANGSATGYTTTTAAGRRYLVYDFIGGYGHYRDAMLLMQKLALEEPLSAAWQSRVGQTWFAANAQPDSATYTADAGMLLTLGDIPGLPGHVVVGPYESQAVHPVSATLGAMFLQIPGMGSRDLEDAVVEQHGSEEWIRFGSTVYRPQATVPQLVAGPNTVTFGAEGYAEWRWLPTAGTVTMAGGASSWRLYDPDMTGLGAGRTYPATVTAPTAGCYLLLFGSAGSSATVTVEPAGGAQPEPTTSGQPEPVAPRAPRLPAQDPWALPWLQR
jgi:hypothetical protein